MSLAVVGVLLLIKLQVRPNTHANGFNRNFNYKASERFRTNIIDAVRITGKGNGRIYLQTTTPNKIIQIDEMLDSVRILEFSGLQNVEQSPWFGSSITWPNLHLFMFNVPSIVSYNLLSGEKVEVKLSKGFVRGCNLFGSSYIVRSFNEDGSDFTFAKILSSDRVVENKKITKQFHDGGFSTDGRLYYDPLSARLVYTYNYQNGFLVIDTNLNLVNSFITIDTNRHFKIIGKKVKNAYTHTGPAEYINYNGAVDSGKLYLQSLLMADNETHEQFDNNAVIDVYNLESGTYSGSFYLPAISGKRASDFIVSKNIITALYGDLLTSYQIIPAED